jgi:lysophospholipase L1-like esterase
MRLSRSRNLIAFVAILLLLVLSVKPVTACAPLRVMPLGDSITHGTEATPPNGYRRPLAMRLGESSILVDFVGSQHDGRGPYDRDHEGHDGWTTSALLQHTPGWLADAQPDAVLLMAGTVDMSALGWYGDPQYAPTLAAVRLAYIVDAITATGATAYVAPIPPLTGIPGADVGPSILQYNTLIRQHVEERAATGMRVRWVPILWSSEHISGDGAHPHEAGYRMMAEAWAAALQAEPLPPGCYQ